MWWIKLFWLEMIIFPVVILYFLSGLPHQSPLQTGATVIYLAVFLCAVSGYIYTWNKKRKAASES